MQGIVEESLHLLGFFDGWERSQTRVSDKATAQSGY